MSSATTSAAFFEAKYRQMADPWNFAGSRYELDRYARIMASLKPRRFRRAFEAGCSIGVLTEPLAGICGQVDALDLSLTAVSHAVARCRHLGNVAIQAGSVRTDVPPGFYDLIVMSEIGYYFQRSELVELGAELSARLVPGGILLGAHWLGHSSDHVLSGDEVHESLNSLANLKLTFSERHPGYRLEHWIKA
jgi:protein-L-isoaspartate O-methyltransferase